MVFCVVGIVRFATMRSVTHFISFYVPLSVFLLINLKSVNSVDLATNDVDNLVEDEITKKLSEDFVQSVEKKFQVDLERAVDGVLVKIKLLLQNGTTHILDRLLELRDMLDSMKKDADAVANVDECLTERQNQTTALAEKALHQMVVCGYALIGHDPAQAVKNVVQLKNIIRQGIKPLYEQKAEVYKLMKVCGHEHDSLKKVVKCVISKSPLIKSAMMDVTGKLIEGVVGLTKLMAHGAMHEACLIEVIKSVEDEAFSLVIDVKNCAYNTTYSIGKVDTFLEEHNATILDVPDKSEKVDDKEDINVSKIFRRAIGSDDKLNEKLKKKYKKDTMNEISQKNDKNGN